MKPARPLSTKGHPMTESERQAWLQLAFTPHIGAESFALLLQMYGTASAALQAPAEVIAQLGKQAKHTAREWHNTSLARAAAEAALQWEQQPGCRLMLSCDSDYPAMLAEGITAPPVLFLRGNPEWLHKPSIAIVGSRHATPQAMRIAHDFGQALSEYGITVISGMAAGIDTAAHQGALKGKAGTIAVWGTGIDRIYPASNRALAHQIAEQGLIVSEFPLDTRPLAGNFPRRNRIIAAQSQAVLVVEAALESGSLITARLASEMGRDVMAIPGSIDNPHAKGCHKLIKEGAKLVENLMDIVDELSYPARIAPSSLKPKTHAAKPKPTLSQPLSTELPTTTPSPEPESTNEHPLLTKMGYDPIHPDTLAEQTGQPAADIYARLTEWELDGIVASMAGGRYQRIK